MKLFDKDASELKSSMNVNVSLLRRERTKIREGNMSWD